MATTQMPVGPVTSGDNAIITTPWHNFLSPLTALSWDTTSLSVNVGSSTPLKITATAVSPSTNSGAALGTTALNWSNLFLGSGSVVNWNNGDVTLTHSANALTFAGASSGYSFDANLLLPSGGVINWNAGNYTLTHSAGNLTAAGGPFTAPSFIPSSSTVPTNGLYLPAANTLGFAISSAGEVQLTSTAMSPITSDGNALGTTALMWSDLFLALGGVINWNNGDVTVTHSSNTLAFAGASTGYTFDAPVSSTSTVATGALTVATLPTAGTKGRRAFVTDSSVNTFNNAVAGGGALNVPVFDDGGGWRVG